MIEGNTRAPALPALTGVRFIAALIVVLYHFWPLLGLPAWLDAVVDGRAAVSLFFVLSGAVMTYNYAGWFETGLGRWRDFFWARFARLYPLHVVSLVLATLAVLLLSTSGRLEADGASAGVLGLSWVLNALLLHAWIPFWQVHLWIVPSWSISVEAFFYLVFPVATLVLARARLNPRRLVLVALLLWGVEALAFDASIVAYALQSDALKSDPWQLVRWSWWPPLRLPEFLIGCILGNLYATGALQRALAPRNGLWAAITLGTLVAVTVFVRAGPQSELLLRLNPYLLFTPLMAFLVAVLMAGPSWLSALLSKPALVILGEASYSLYLLHWLPYSVLGPYGPAQGHPPIGVAWLVVLLTVAASLVTWAWFERPAKDRLRRLRTSRVGAPVPAALDRAA